MSHPFLFDNGENYTTVAIVERCMKSGEKIKKMGIQEIQSNVLMTIAIAVDLFNLIVIINGTRVRDLVAPSPYKPPK